MCLTVDQTPAGPSEKHEEV